MQATVVWRGLPAVDKVDLPGEHKEGEDHTGFRVADRVLSREEVLEQQRQLSLLSEPTVRNQYNEAHAKCCLARGKLPTPGRGAALLESVEGAVAVGTEFATSKGTVSVMGIFRQSTRIYLRRGKTALVIR